MIGQIISHYKILEKLGESPTSITVISVPKDFIGQER